MKAKSIVSKAALTALSFLAVSASFSAHAQFKDMDAEPAAQAMPAHRQTPQGDMGMQRPASEDLFQAAHRGKLTQIGVSRGTVDQVKGFGKELSLVDALKIVVPSGWNAKRLGVVDVSQSVILKGNGSWVEAASSFAEQTQTHIIVDWEQKVVTVHGHPRAVSSSGTIQLAGAVPKVAAPAVAVEVKPVVPPVPTWTLSAGKSLRENIESWAPKANYKVTWQAVNYMISAGAVYSGAFDDEMAGPINAIVKTFECHDVPLKATFMEDNRVLVIENSAFRSNTSCSKSAPQ